MNEVRCTTCSKFLFAADVQHEACKESPNIEIVCVRCKTKNKYKRK